MARHYTEQELYKFVWRADTFAKIALAEDYLKKCEYIDNDLFDDLMRALSWQYTELQMADRRSIRLTGRRLA